jgi:hypothetical protein
VDEQLAIVSVAKHGRDESDAEALGGPSNNVAAARYSGQESARQDVQRFG